MEILILRHADAGKPDSARYPDDALRPLSENGKKEIMKIAKGMKLLGLGFDAILSSPFARARQTAEIVKSVYGSKKKIRYSENLIVGASCRTFMRELKTIGANGAKVLRLLVAGHEPFLSEFMGMATIGCASSFLKLKKGGLCKLDWDPNAKKKTGVLCWLMTPGQLCAVAK